MCARSCHIFPLRYLGLFLCDYILVQIKDMIWTVVLRIICQTPGILVFTSSEIYRSLPNRHRKLRKLCGCGGILFKLQDISLDCNHF